MMLKWCCDLQLHSHSPYPGRLWSDSAHDSEMGISENIPCTTHTSVCGYLALSFSRFIYLINEHTSFMYIHEQQNMLIRYCK